MINLTKEIYAKLLTITDSVHFSILPEGVDETVTHIVFEVTETGSYNSLNSNNYANNVDLTVKILNPDALELLEVGEQVKQALLNTSLAYIRDLVYNGSVPIFRDYDLETQQLTLMFNLYADTSVIEVVDGTGSKYPIQTLAIDTELTNDSANVVEGRVIKAYVDTELSKVATAEHTHEQYLTTVDLVTYYTKIEADTAFKNASNLTSGTVNIARLPTQVMRSDSDSLVFKSSNLTSLGNDLTLQFSNGTNSAFRAVRANAFDDNKNSVFFQVGNAVDDESVVFTAKNGVTMDRTLMNTRHFIIANDYFGSVDYNVNYILDVQGRTRLQEVHVDSLNVGSVDLLEATKVTETVGLTTDAGTSIIKVGSKGFREIPFTGKIISYSIITSDAGNINYTIKKGSLNNMASATTILQPVLTNQATVKQTGLAISVTEGEVIEFIIDAADIKKCQLFLQIKKD